MTRSQILSYSDEMKGIGVNVVILKNGQKFFPGLPTKMPVPQKMRGAYHHPGKTIFLRKGVTEYEAFHEATHARQHYNLGKDAYIAQGQFAREAHVFNEVYKKRHQFSYAERSHAAKYIRSLRNDFKNGKIN